MHAHTFFFSLPAPGLPPLSAPALALPGRRWLGGAPGLTAAPTGRPPLLASGRLC